MSEEKEMMDYEAHNAKAALDLVKEKAENERLRSEKKGDGYTIEMLGKEIEHLREHVAELEEPNLFINETMSTEDIYDIIEDDCYDYDFSIGEVHVIEVVTARRLPPVKYKVWLDEESRDYQYELLEESK